MVYLILSIAFLLLVYFFFKIRHISNMLIILSEDINEIKEKLGLEKYLLTKEQENEDLMRRYIKKQTFEAMQHLDNKNKKDRLGLRLRWKYHKWIGYCHLEFDKQYPRKKRCPECLQVVWECYDKCPDCKVKLERDWVKP
jgi:hypothetical protein